MKTNINCIEGTVYLKENNMMVKNFQRNFRWLTLFLVSTLTVSPIILLQSDFTVVKQHLLSNRWLSQTNYVFKPITIAKKSSPMLHDISNFNICDYFLQGRRNHLAIIKKNSSRIPVECGNLDRINRQVIFLADSKSICEAQTLL